VETTNHTMHIQHIIRPSGCYSSLLFCWWCFFLWSFFAS